VTRGMEGCLNVYAAAEWQGLADRISAIDPLSRDGREMRRFFFTGAVSGGLDKQGRMVLPAPLLDSVGIEREVTVAGMYDHLEVWDRTKWREHLREVEGRAEDVAERLAN
jgi:MraZ protein